MANVQSIDSSNFDVYMQSPKGVKAIRFWATWCHPCKMLEPIYDEVADEMDASVSFGEVDIDKAPDIAANFAIRGVPTVLVFKNGEVMDQIVGLSPKSRYVKALQQLA